MKKSTKYLQIFFKSFCNSQLLNALLFAPCATAAQVFILKDFRAYHKFFKSQYFFKFFFRAFQEFLQLKKIKYQTLYI